MSPSAEVEDPKLVAWSESVANLLDLDPKEYVAFVLVTVNMYLYHSMLHHYVWRADVQVDRIILLSI